MSTPYSTLTQAFFRRIEEDKDFFDYLNLNGYESMELAEQRAKALMLEAIGFLTLKCTPTINFYNFDDALGIFVEDLTGQEVFLLSSIMYQQYLERDIAKLKCLNVNFTPTELKVFDPSNARTSFSAIYERVCNQNLQLIDDYASKDRLTGKFIGINFAAYNEE